MKRLVISSLQLGWWLFYQVFFCGVYLLPEKGEIHDLPQLAALALATGMISFYAAWFHLSPRYAARQRWLALLLSAMLVSLLAALPAPAAIMGEVYWATRILPEYRVMAGLWAGFAFLALLNAAVAIVVRGFISWFNAEKEKEQLEKHKLQTELTQIRTQLHPHFLFNTIHNINILIEDAPLAASAYLQKLAGLLRYTLYETSAELVHLEKEIGFIRGYLELQQLRTSNPHYASFSVKGEVGGLMVPPFLLTPFIENAFKHTPDKKQPDAIAIALHIRQSQVHFTCVNKTATTTGIVYEGTGGLGLSLARQRLELLYKKAYSLVISQNDAIFKVDLTLETGC